MAGTEFDANFGRRRFFYDTNTNLLSFHSPTNFIRIYREKYRTLSLSFSSLRPLPMCISITPSPPSTAITISPYDSAYLINSTSLHSTIHLLSRNPSRDLLHTSIPVFAYMGMSNHLFVQKRLSDFSSPYIKCPRRTRQQPAVKTWFLPHHHPPHQDLGYFTCSLTWKHQARSAQHIFEMIYCPRPERFYVVYAVVLNPEDLT
ncbi:uncharacterized protein RAG0_06995 [Rhynchosporium agropyri]|uniref:Uncharacterized protein n=1 Tax=Rhynchosporium agropyri TaxID=914238 RepID=A0A1E1KJF7_9HELO|nr:uncharacterized protein RAG0_06995 [Rhynchosporium agropyri]